ncbi:MAG: hypothetical protein QOJ44_1282, partial [Acidimicrobiaceae bacterium]|nr:hypothetical protein [Acidimicrobiaceae bacterium]
MVKGRHSRFGLSSSGEGSRRFTRTQKIVSLSVVAAIVILTTVFAVIGQPSIAVQPKPFGGSLTLNDVQDPVVIDLATGSPNLRLQGIESQVGATDPSLVDAVPLADGTLLVNRSTGTFNVLGLGNSIVKTSGGIALGDLSGTTGAAGFAAGDNGYIVRYAPSAATISLVDQATVAAAARSGAGTPGSGTSVPLLGFAAVSDQIPTDPGATVVANGDLWTITRALGQGTLQRFTPGAPGKQLGASPFGGVDPVAALGTGSTAGGETVALAEPSDIRIMPAGQGGGTAQATTVQVAAGTRVDRIVPVGNGDGQVLFAYHSQAGWRLVGVDLASGQALAERAITGLPAKTTLESPVINNGAIYAIADDGSATPPLVKIDPWSGTAAPLPGATSYPVAGPGEATTFVDPGLPPQVISVGPRVIINNPNRVLAIVVFTDGSRPTRVIDKRTAVSVDPSTLPGAPVNNTPSNVPAKDVVSQPQQVDTQLRCKTISQKPRVPVLDQPVPSSHSVSLSWTYSLLDNQDCEPTSYLVTVAVVGGGPTPATTQFPVNGQTQFTVPGLRPNTTYSFVVTALINTQSTPSLPREVTTNPQGPDAPLTVTTVANGGSGWTVSWTVCQGDACDSNLPAANWTVTGSSCGSGSQFIGTPPVVSVPGTGGAVQSATVPFDQFPTLVGDQLTFSVQGTSATGLAGDPTGDGTCTEGWRPADPSMFTVVGSAVAAGGTTVTATLQVQPNPGVSSVQAFGSNTVRFSFSVIDQTTGQTSPPQSGSAASAAFSGLAPGHTYIPAVSVTPLISPTPGSTITGAPFGTTVPWPSGITAVQAGPVTVTPGNLNTGTAPFTIANVYAVPSATVTASATVTCGNTSVPAGSGLAVTPSGTSGSVAVPMDYTQEGGNCSVVLTLSDGPSGPYGALPLVLPAAGLTANPPAFTVPPGDFIVTSVPVVGIQVTSKYSGGGGVGWAIDIIAPGCSVTSVTNTPGGTGGPWAAPPIKVPSCLTGSTVDVQVTYSYPIGSDFTIELGSVTVTPIPTAPTVTSISPMTGPAAGG